MRPIACVILLFTACIGVAIGRGAAAESLDDVSELRAFQREQLDKMAESAQRKGYATLARRCAEFRIRTLDFSAGGDEFREEAERRAHPMGDDSPKLTARARASLEAAFTKTREKIAAKLAAVAAEQVAGPGEELTQTLAREAIEYDPECAVARKILGQRHVKGWGWVKADTADRLDMGEVEIGDDWRPRKGLGKDPRPWGEEWVVRSDHFVVRSNLPLKRVFEARDLLESLRDRILADWEGNLRMRPLVEPHEVLIFATEPEYAAYLRDNDPQHIKGVPGQYSPNLRRSMFFDVETLRAAGGQTSSLTELMLHECTHQLFHELVAIDPQALEGAQSPNHWLHEGIAEYYGMHTPGKSGLVLDDKAIRGMLRTRHVKDNLAIVPSASAMAAMTKAEFQSPDGNQRATHYAAAGFLCRHLSEGATRSGWQGLVRAVYTGGNSRTAYAGAFGGSFDEIDASFAKFLRSLSTAPRRAAAPRRRVDEARVPEILWSLTRSGGEVMGSAHHAAAAVVVIALAAGAASAAFDTAGIDVQQATTSSLKTKHRWKTAGKGGDGSVQFLPFITVVPGEFSAGMSGSVTVQQQDATQEMFFFDVHAGKGSRNRDTSYRAKIGPGDGALGRSFGAVLSDLVYALDLSLPQSTGGGTFAKQIEAFDGAVDVTRSKGLVDLRDRGQGRVDVKFKATYKGTIIFGPNAGKRVSGKIQIVAKGARQNR